MSILPRYALPLVAIGLSIVIISKASLIEAAYGLYLGVAGAFAVTHLIPRRRLLGMSCVLGVIVLIAFTGKRGPTLTILLAVLAAWLAASTFRSLTATGAIALGASVAVGALALVISMGFVNPSHLPVIGRLAGRVIATNSTVSSAGANVALREHLWSYALHTTYAQNPLLGVGAYYPIPPALLGDARPGTVTGLHNSFIGYTYYAGFPAGLIVVILFAMGLVRLWRCRQTTPYAPALFGALVAVVVTALTNVALETTYIGGPSWLVLAADMGVSARQQTEQARRSGQPKPGILRLDRRQHTASRGVVAADKARGGLAGARNDAPG